MTMRDVILKRANRGVKVLDEGDGLLAGHATDHICENTSADDPAQLYYTSGTTGQAKGIVHATLLRDSDR